MSPENAFTELERWYALGISNATSETNANMYNVIHNIRADNIPYQLSLYDIAGEAFGKMSSDIQQQQFKYCEGIIMIIDSDISIHNIVIMDTDNTLVTIEKYTPDVPDLSDYSGSIRYLIEASVASETRRAYTSRLKRFVNWCNEKGLSCTYPIAPEILAMYITDMAGDGLSNATITQTMAAVSTTHKTQGLTSPTESL